MSWIRVVHESDADGALADVYDRVGRQRGKVANIMRVQSLAPAAMAAHVDLYLDLMFSRGGLTRAERELIAVVVSGANGCHYCTLHHAAALEAWWRDADRVARLRRDPDSAGLSARETRLVDYAERLTRSPADVKESDVQALRTAGLTDREILQANMITAYFNFVNRIAEGLGVDAPQDEVGGYRY